ncbi:MAG: fibrobacter succinogenes major paralogous domain-containing protein, partial [Candidatus Marinimicrobia bacterium]|nr:fibrobacter succinogenes major paralogous domain-containing protein [Candidatus Neomarinimicrobiota bacterium]
MTDIDGNTYKVVKIANQIWMAENLKVTKYRDGTVIPDVTDAGAWTGLSTGAYCFYNNDANNAETYGALYNWYAVNGNTIDTSRIFELAPEGWHVPTDAEWKELEMFLGMSQSTAD